MQADFYKQQAKAANKNNNNKGGNGGQGGGKGGGPSGGGKKGGGKQKVASNVPTFGMPAHLLPPEHNLAQPQIAVAQQPLQPQTAVAQQPGSAQVRGNTSSQRRRQKKKKQEQAMAGAQFVVQQPAPAFPAAAPSASAAAQFVATTPMATPTQDNRLPVLQSALDGFRLAGNESSALVIANLIAEASSCATDDVDKQVQLTVPQAMHGLKERVAQSVKRVCEIGVQLKAAKAAVDQCHVALEKARDYRESLKDALDIAAGEVEAARKAEADYWASNPLELATDPKEAKVSNKIPREVGKGGDAEKDRADSVSSQSSHGSQGGRAAKAVKRDNNDKGPGGVDAAAAEPTEVQAETITTEEIELVNKAYTDKELLKDNNYRSSIAGALHKVDISFEVFHKAVEEGKPLAFDKGAGNVQPTANDAGALASPTAIEVPVK